MDPTLLMQILPMLSGNGGGGGIPGMGQFQKMAGSGLDMLRFIRAMRELKELQNKPRPNYEISPELQKSYNRAESRAGMGFTPTQTQQFNQNLSSTLNADFVNSRNMGGGSLAQALMGNMLGRRLGAINRFASDDATRQAANIAYADQMGNRIQGQRNMRTGQEIGYRMNDERALGQAAQDSYMNFRNTLGSEAAMDDGANMPDASMFGGSGYGNYGSAASGNIFQNIGKLGVGKAQ